MKIKISIIYFILFCVIYNSQTLTSYLSTNNIRYGEPVVLRLEVKASSSDQIIFPSSRDTLSYHLEILKVKQDTLIPNNERHIYIDSITFSSYEAGIFTVPPQRVIINDQNYLTPEYKITVNSLPVDSLNRPLYDIKPIITEPKIFQDYFEQYWMYMIMGLVILIVAIVLAILYYLERKKKRVGGYKGANPDIIAIKKINRLEKSSYLKKGSSKKYYSEMISILKEYMESRWKFPATKLLSDDLIDYLEKKEWIDEKEKQDLIIIFNSADLAKFAKSRPTIAETKVHTEMAKKFINDTKTEFYNLREQNEY